MHLGFKFVLGSFGAMAAMMLVPHPAWGNICTPVADLTGFCGAWLLTSPLGDRRDREAPRHLRLLVRTSYSIAIAGALAVTVLSATELATWLDTAMRKLEAGIMMFFLAKFILLLWYLHGFSSSIADTRLTRSSKIVIWGLSACGAVFVSIHLLGLALNIDRGWDAGTPIGAMVGAILPMLIIALVVFGLWSIVLMAQYHARFGALRRGAIARDPGSRP